MSLRATGLGCVVLIACLLGSLLPHVERASADPPARPDLPDLEVTFIERTPRFARYCHGVNDIVPCDASTYSDPAAEPHWPAAGTLVTYWGHIKNSGLQASAAEAYAWFLHDGTSEQFIEAGDIDPIAVGEEVIVPSPPLPFPDVATATTHEYPRLRLEVYTFHADGYASNNERTYYVLGKSYLFFTPQDTYDYANANLNGDCVDGSGCAAEHYYGTYSYEDWLQRQFAAMNQKMAESDLDVPGGSRERVNLENLFVFPSGQTPQQYFGAFEQTLEPGSDPPKNERRYTYDGEWLNAYTSPSSIPLTGVEWGLMHELSHQLGAIDIYNIPYTGNAPGCTAGILGSNNDPDCDRGSFQTNQEIWDYEAVHVRAFNRKLPYRAGYYGEFLYDVPSTNTVILRDSSGAPLANAEVNVVQPIASVLTQPASRHLWNLRTDSNGEVQLPNQPVTPVTTLTGYTLHENPWGDIDLLGTNGWLYLSITSADGQTDTVILDILWANDKAATGQAGLYPFTTGIATPTATQVTSFAGFAESAGAMPWLREVQATVLSNVNRVDFYVDGVLRQRDVVAPYDFTWDLRLLPAGRHWVTARAYDLEPDEDGAVVTYESSEALCVEVNQSQDPSCADASVAADPVASLGSRVGVGASVQASAGVRSDTSLALLVDGEIGASQGWWGGFAKDSFIEIDLGQPQLLAAVKVYAWSENYGDQCPYFDLYVTFAEVSATDIPVVVDRSKEPLAGQIYVFPTVTARYVTYVCRADTTYAKIPEIEIYPPASLGPTVGTLQGDLTYELGGSPPVPQTASAASLSWATTSSALYYVVCRDASATGTYGDCPYTLPGSGVTVPYPETEGGPTYYKVKACTVFDQCGPFSSFAGVGRAMPAGADYGYVLSSTPDDLEVRFTSFTASQAVRLHLAGGTNASVDGVLGSSVCLDASSGWSSSAPASARLWKFVSSFATVASSPTDGTCSSSSMPNVSAGRVAVVPTRLFGPQDVTSSVIAQSANYIRLQWASRPGADQYVICVGSDPSGESADCSQSVTGTETQVNVISSEVWYYWVRSCDAASICGPLSRSYAVGYNNETPRYLWTHYKTNTTFGFQSRGIRSSFHIFDGASTAAPLLLTTDCTNPFAPSSVYTMPAASVTSPQLTVSLHTSGGPSCPNDAYHVPHEPGVTAAVRQMAAPAQFDFSIDDTGTSPNQYRTKLQWADDPNASHYRYCTASSVPGTFSCPPSQYIRRTFQYVNFPAAGTGPKYLRAIACDVDNFCSPMTPEYVQHQRASYSYFWNFAFVYLRPATLGENVRFQFANFSNYLGAPLALKLHVLKSATLAEGEIVAGMDTCALTSPGVSGVGSAPLSSFGTSPTVLTVWNHYSADPPIDSACTSGTGHASDGDLGHWSGAMSSP